jgi:8-oxo-dGTP pyrophosphatase MutT (NUDIX family)
VLVLLYPDASGEALLVLTERPTGNLRHSGQISFPGGAVEPGDEYPTGTALREAAEEVALDAAGADVEIFGVLRTVDMRQVSGFVVTPVLAVASREPVLVPDEREVASILRVPVSLFLPDAPIEIVEADRDGWRMRYGAYAFGEYRIWGMTAGILGQLGAVLGGHGEPGRVTRRPS